MKRNVVNVRRIVRRIGAEVKPTSNEWRFYINNRAAHDANNRIKSARWAYYLAQCADIVRLFPF